MTYGMENLQELHSSKILEVNVLSKEMMIRLENLSLELMKELSLGISLEVKGTNVTIRELQIFVNV